MRRLSSFAAVVALASLLAGLLNVPNAHAQAYQAQPKLVVIVVIDQFRGDYLQRYRSELKGRGFRLLLDEGAWFPDCYYNYANTKTAPGHATIGTGAYSDGHGIEANEWWDAARSFEHKVSSVQDERYTVVGAPAGSEAAKGPAASPRSLRASTLGDELRLGTSGRSLVYGVSLKDRAAILPPGQSANGAFWIDGTSGQFLTSSYYMDKLPDWAAAFNASGRVGEAFKEVGADGKGKFTASVELSSAANHYELDFAQALITGEKLGQHPTTDLLTVSLSAHDVVGHRFGPDSEQERAMVLGLDSDLDRFFAWLDKSVGLNNVWIALTADHGVAPTPAYAAKLGINAATVDLKPLGQYVNDALNRKFSSSKQVNYLILDPSVKPNQGLELPYITLDKRVFEAAGIDEKTAEEALKAALPDAVAKLAGPEAASTTGKLPPRPMVVGAYTKLQLERGELPPTELGRELAHSYSSHGNWYVMLVLGGYEMEDVTSWGGPTGTTHFSPWSYDRHVPLAFYGAPFAAGTYRGRVEPVDLAATFASLLGVNLPSASVGRVLTDSLKVGSAKAATR